MEIGILRDQDSPRARALSVFGISGLGKRVGGRFIVGSLFWVPTLTFYLLVEFCLCCQL